jgi:hypothetical protein
VKRKNQKLIKKKIFKILKKVSDLEIQKMKKNQLKIVKDAVESYIITKK